MRELVFQANVARRAQDELAANSWAIERWNGAVRMDIGEALECVLEVEFVSKSCLSDCMGMLREVFDTNVAKYDRRAVPALRGRVPLRPETATLFTMFQGRRCGYTLTRPTPPRRGPA